MSIGGYVQEPKDCRSLGRQWRSLVFLPAEGRFEDPSYNVTVGNRLGYVVLDTESDIFRILLSLLVLAMECKTRAGTPHGLRSTSVMDIELLT
jgi:hypothetical protein